MQPESTHGPLGLSGRDPNYTRRMEVNMGTVILTGPQAAKLLGVREQTLRAWRVRGTGPAFIRYGGPKGRVRYAQEALDEWLAHRTFESTSQEVARGGARDKELPESTYAHGGDSRRGGSR